MTELLFAYRSDSYQIRSFLKSTIKKCLELSQWFFNGNRPSTGSYSLTVAESEKWLLKRPQKQVSF